MRRTCDVTGCSDEHLARGKCSFHYQRLKNGVPFDPEVLDLYYGTDLPEIGIVSCPDGRQRVWPDLVTALDPDDPMPEVTADDLFIADDGTLHDTFEDWFSHQEGMGVWAPGLG